MTGAEQVTAIYEAKKKQEQEIQAHRRAAQYNFKKTWKVFSAHGGDLEEYDINDIKHEYYGAGTRKITVHSLDRAWIVDSHGNHHSNDAWPEGVSRSDMTIKDFYELRLLEEALLEFVGIRPEDRDREYNNNPIVQKRIRKMNAHIGYREDGKPMYGQIAAGLCVPAFFIALFGIPILLLILF